VLSDAPNRSASVHEEVVEGIFDAGEERTLQVRARWGFRVRYLELDQCESGAFVMTSFGVDAHEQLIVPGPFSLDVFRNQAPVMLPAVGSNWPVTMDIKNVSKKTQRLRIRLVGEVT
jgi:hypothetical protein